jgi:hypothetical protein
MYPNLQVYQGDMPSGNITVNANHEIRFTTSLANLGVGAFDLRADGAVINNPDGTQSIVTNQRVYNDDNNNGVYNVGVDTTFTEQLAGTFSYHPTHGHMHFNEFAIARLRIRPLDNSIGAVVAVGPKTSFCLEDLGHPYPALPGSPSAVQYVCASNFEGISIGWKDIYNSTLDGQYINVTNIPNGNYWLEIECDYANHIQETNETDNISRTQITISNQPATGFLVLSATPFGAQQSPVSYVDFAFNQSVDPLTFTTDAVTFTGPPGSTNIPITSVQMLDSAHFRVNFATQSTFGTYNMTLDPNLIRNATGQKLDQNNNGVGGESGDGFTNIFAISAPFIQNGTPAGQTAAPISSVRINYDRPMNSTTFSQADVLSFTGPGGLDLSGTITSVTPVTAGGQSEEFLVNFTSVSSMGIYTMVVGPNVQDMAGNYVDQNHNGIPNESADQFSNVFSIQVGGYGPDAFGYTAVSTPVPSVSMTGATSITFTDTDDDFSLINLGADSFNFYGTTYTGGTSVYVTSNGLITFDSSTNNWTNDNLTSLTMPAISVLWDDWIIGSGNPQARYVKRDTNMDGINDQLIVEWNQIYHVSTASNGVTFQALLELNTGARPGKITINYPDITTGSASYTNGASATVGLRSDTSLNSRFVVSQNSNSHPLVGTGKAMILSVPSVTGITRLDPNPAPDGEVLFQVSFSDNVTGVDPSDFVTTTTPGMAPATVVGVIPTGDAKVWQMVVETGVGSGTLGLNLVDNDSIVSLVGARLGGGGANNGDFSAGEKYTIVQQPPQVFQYSFGDGSAQRSQVSKIQISFDHPVDFANNDMPAAFQLVGPNGAVPVSVDTTLSSPEQTVVTLTFPPGPGVESNGSLKNGLYALTILSTKVSTGGINLDGDGNGTVGPDYVLNFHRLFGDANGDLSVNSTDFSAFRAVFGTSSGASTFDTDGNNVVDATDFVQFRLTFGTTLVP